MVILIIIGALLVFMIVFTIWNAKNTVTGICPECGKKIGLLKGIGACSNCGEPLRKQNDQFVPIEPGFLPDHLLFNISLGKLKDPKKWQTTWQGRCCVCGKTATQQKTVKVKTISGSAGPLLGPQTNITDTTKFEVGYCDAHQDGLRFSFPPGFGNVKKTEQCYLHFRSVDYYREFLGQNKKEG